MGVSVLGVAYGSGATAPLTAGTAAPGDIVVALTTDNGATPLVPSGMTGCGATWALVHASVRTSVWIGTAPTTIGTVTATGGAARGTAAWWLRDAAPIASVSWVDSPTGTLVAADAVTVGPTQAILAFARASDALPDVGSLPSIGAWTAAASTSTRRAHAAPNTTDTYQATTSRSGARVTLVQAVIGTPPPDAPTGLVLTPDVDTINAAWTPPAGAGVATGYTVSLDGATPVDVGNVTSWVLGPLTPATLYTVDVRAYNAAGTSPPVSGSATTLVEPTPDPPPGGWVGHLRVGEHVWDVLSTDEATHGPTAPLTFGWTAPQNDGWPTQPDPTLLSFGVVVPEGTDFDDVDQGTWVHYTFTPDGYTDPLVEFGGTVRDLTARPVPQGMLYSLVAVDPLKRLQEDYATEVTLPAAFPVNDIWDELVQDGGGTLGTEPALPDPLAGQDKPGSGGFVFAETTLAGTTWDVLTGFARNVPIRPGATPTAQRVILGYQLDTDGDLDAAAPFLGTWMQQGSAALEVVEVDGALVPTDSAEWSRQRIEPNMVHSAGTTWTRAHTGADIVLESAYLTDPGFSVTEPNWVLDGVDGASQWATALVLLASRAPSLVEGWFTLPTALNTYVEVEDIDPRHTPDGTTTYKGLLAGAQLTVRPGGTWSVAFTLRRTQPTP